MNIFAFLVEPSSYTLDIVEKIYRPLKIDYIFFQDRPLIAKSDKQIDIDVLKNFGFLKKLILLKEIYRKNDMFIFNGYDRFEFILLFLSTWLGGGRKTIAIDSDTMLKERKGLKGLLKRIYLTNIFTKKFVLGFAGGNYGHKDLFRHYGMDEERIFLMPMMVNNETFYNNTRHTDASSLTFLYVGRIIPHKNVEMLIQSFIRALETEGNIILRIVGTGSLKDTLEQKYAHVPQIVFEGPKFGEDLVRVYHESDVLVIPSLYEPWGLVVNEALSAGLPVLASNRVGAINDLIVNRDTGFIFDPENIQELTDLMKRIANDGELFERMSKNAVDLMKNEWNYDLYRGCLLSAIGYVEKQKELPHGKG